MTTTTMYIRESKCRKLTLQCKGKCESFHCSNITSNNKDFVSYFYLFVFESGSHRVMGQTNEIIFLQLHWKLSSLKTNYVAFCAFYFSSNVICLDINWQSTNFKILENGLLVWINLI